MQQFVFHTRCVESTAEAIDGMTETGREITWETFKRQCDWRSVAQQLGYNTGRHNPRNPLRLHTDRLVSFYRATFQGKPCYYFVWSAIEFVFLLEPDHHELRKASVLDNL